MKTLEQLWDECGHDKSKKFRFIDWNFKTRYFVVEKISEDGKKVSGHLDCGTPISFPSSSDFWTEYSEGDEHSARSI